MPLVQWIYRNKLLPFLNYIYSVNVCKLSCWKYVDLHTFNIVLGGTDLDIFEK